MKLLPPILEGQASQSYRAIAEGWARNEYVLSMSDAGGADKPWDAQHVTGIAQSLMAQPARGRMLELEGVQIHWTDPQSTLGGQLGAPANALHDSVRTYRVLRQYAQPIGNLMPSVYVDIENADPNEKAILYAELNRTIKLLWRGARLFMWDWDYMADNSVSASHIAPTVADHGATLAQRIATVKQHAGWGHPIWVTLGAQADDGEFSAQVQVCRQGLNPSTDNVIVYCSDADVSADLDRKEASIRSLSQ